MISYDSLTLKLFTEENAEYFKGAKIQKVQQPSRFELIFIMRSKGISKKLYINFNPDFFHICFIEPETEKMRGVKIPKNALMFCMLLRKYIQNAKITSIAAPEYERIFEIYFEYYNELGEKSQLCLAAELMGRYSNVILYNYDTNVIIGCAHNVSAEKSRERGLCGLMPYVYPKKQHKKNLLNTDFETFKSAVDLKNIPMSVSAGFYYLTAVLVQDAAELIKPFDLKILYEKLLSILKNSAGAPCIKNDYSKYYAAEFPDTFKCSCINEMTDKYFAHHQQKYNIEQLKSKICRHADMRLKKLNELKLRQQQQTKKLYEALEYKNKADVLKAYLYNLKPGRNSVKLYDFEGKEIQIELDENKSPAENAAAYYSLYKKAKTAAEYAETMLKKTQSEILYYEEIKYSAENTENASDLYCLLEETSEDKPQDEDKTSVNIQCFEIEGFKIYAGKNKKQNDYILSKLAGAEDLWFHPLNAAGAHIIVKTEKKEPPASVLLKAAEITKEYSMQKNNSKTSIIYTKRKYVKKASEKQAFVTYKNETEIIV